MPFDVKVKESEVENTVLRNDCLVTESVVSNSKDTSWNTFFFFRHIVTSCLVCLDFCFIYYAILFMGFQGLNVGL